MKQIYYLFLINVLWSTCLYGDVVLLQEKAINQKIITIKKMIAHHNQVVTGLTTLGYIQQLSYWLPFITDFFLPQNSSKIVEKKEELGFFDGIAQDIHEFFGTPKGWRRMGKMGFYVATQIGAFFLFQKISDTVYHPNTLRWYIKAKVPYEKTIIIIEKIAQKLTNVDYDDHTRQHYKVILRDSCKQLVGYGEDICAYMLYKSIELSDNQKMLAERTSRYLFNYQNEVFQKIFNELDHNEQHYGDIIVLIKSYQAELKYQRKIFSSIEGEIQKDLDFASEFCQKTHQ